MVLLLLGMAQSRDTGEGWMENGWIIGWTDKWMEEWMDGEMRVRWSYGQANIGTKKCFIE